MLLALYSLLESGGGGSGPIRRQRRSVELGLAAPIPERNRRCPLVDRAVREDGSGRSFHLWPGTVEDTPMKRHFLALAALLAAVSLASAQTYLDSKGTVVSGVALAGSTGADYSANIPTLPNVGANFAASGPYASYVLVATVAASATRKSIDIENDSGAQIAILLDDGTAASGATPNNASVFALSGGSGAGALGGSWVSQVERGRVQVYAPASTAQVAVRTN